MGIKHRKITSRHPHANGEVERFIKAAIVENKHWE